jgi:hypothetical protein
MGVDSKRGEPCETLWRVLADDQERSLLALRPRTGRRHQLRVHCYHLGHPILGDPLYGEATVQRTYPRLFLHAGALTAPELGLAVVCPPPEVFLAALPMAWREAAMAALARVTEINPA